MPSKIKFRQLTDNGQVLFTTSSATKHFNLDFHYQEKHENNSIEEKPQQKVSV